MCVCLPSRATYPWITSVCELELSCESAVMLCQHFASESHRKATAREERGEKEEASSYFVWPRSRPATSRWGFQSRYPGENNISRVSKKPIEHVCTKNVKIRDIHAILLIAENTKLFFFTSALKKCLSFNNLCVSIL